MKKVIALALAFLMAVQICAGLPMFLAGNAASIDQASPLNTSAKRNFNTDTSSGGMALPCSGACVGLEVATLSTQTNFITSTGMVVIEAIWHYNYSVYQSANAVIYPPGTFGYAGTYACKGAYVELWRQNSGGHEVVQSTFTDSNGRVAFNPVIKGIYSVVIYADDKAIVKVSGFDDQTRKYSNSSYYWTTGWQTVDTSIVYNRVLVDPNYNNQVWMIYDSIRNAHDWLKLELNWSRPQVTAYFPSSTSTSYATYDNMKLSYPATLRTITHEYGHNIMFYLYQETYPTDDGSDSPSPSYALGEGFAYFIADAAFAVPSRYINTSEDVESRIWADGTDYGDWDGNSNLFSVENVLWDIYDGVDANDFPSWDKSKYGDFVNKQLPYLWNILRTYRPNNIDEVWQHWEPKNADVWMIFYHQRMDCVLKPSAPTSLVASSGDSEVSLSWNKSLYSLEMAVFGNVSDVIEYKISYGTSSETMFNQVICHQPFYTVEGISNGQTYYFKVAARNNIGWGLNSSIVSVVPESTIVIPQAPDDLVVTPGDGQVSLSWRAPPSDGGGSIDYYVVYQDGVEASHSLETSVTVLNLTNGLSYNFSIAAHNSVGLGFRTENVTAMPSASDTIPGAPYDVVVTPMNGKVSLSWSQPDNNGGAPIDYYIVYQDGIDVLHTVEMEASIAGMVNGQTYTFTVAAHNSIGEGLRSSAVNVTPSTIMTVPSSPTGLTAELGNGVVHLLWNVTSNNGGSSVTVYRIYRGLTETTMNAIATTVDTQYIDPNTADDTTYYYGVAAVNAIGEGEMSDVVVIIIKSSSEPEPDPSPSFLTTIEGQLAIAGLAIAGVGAVTYLVWRRRRP